MNMVEMVFQIYVSKIHLNLFIENYLITKNMVTLVGLREEDLGNACILYKIQEILFPLKEETINYVN